MAPPAPVPLPWASLAQARELWPDARTLDDDVLAQILDAAGTKVYEYASPLTRGAPEREDARAHAQVLAARDLWTAYRVDGGADVISFDQYAIRVRPLSAAVMSLLRPARGVPQAR